MRMLAGLVVACLCVALTGCGGPDTHETVMADALAGLKEMNQILAGVTDEASAKAAGPKMEALAKRMEALKARADKLGEPSAEAKKQLEAKFKPEMEKAAQEMMGNMFKFMSNPKIAEALKEPMEKLQKAAPVK